MSFLSLGFAFGFDPSENFSGVVVSTAITLGFTEGGITGTGRCGGGGAALLRPFISLHLDKLNLSIPNNTEANAGLNASNSSRE